MFEAEGEAGDGMLTEADHYDNLGEIWRSVGIDPAQDLTIADLARVCQHIGMDMTQQELDQLFSRLDGDGDGRITYEEFHEGLFQHGLTSSSQGPTDGPPLSTIPSADTTRSRASLPGTPASHPRPPNRRLSRGLTPVRYHDDSLRPLTPALTPSTLGSGLFSAIDLDQTGLCSTEGIVENWESLGVSEGEDVLLNLGFNSQSKISLSELSFLLTQEIASAADQNSTFQAAFLSYQQELQHTRMLVEQTTAEKNKLRADMLAANSRNEILVKEADERHIRLEQSMEAKIVSLEQKYQSEIRMLQSALEEERDSQANQSNKARQRLEDRIEGLKHEESRVKQNLILSQKENERLERDVRDLMDQLDEAQTLNQQLQKDLQAAGELHQAVMDGQFPEDWQGFSQGRQQQLQTDNKVLRDRVDELTAEVERLKHEVMSSRRGSSHGVRPLQSPTGSPSNKRRRQVATEYLTSEESMDEGPRPLSPGQETMSDARLLGLEKELEQAVGELELAKQRFEDERKDIEQVFKMEIVGIEEGHDRDREQLVQAFAREKERLTEELASAHQGALAELERTLQNDFAAAKQEMILKHESEKNYMEHQHAAERERLEQRLEAAAIKGGTSSSTEEISREKASLQDRFLKEKMQLEEVHAKEKSDIFKDVEAERNELISQYKEEIGELKERITGLRERLEVADAKVIEGQARLRETETKLRETETKLRETETKLREAIQELYEANMKVTESSRKADQAGNKLREVEVKLKETAAKLSESEAKLADVMKGHAVKEDELRDQVTRELRDRLRRELEEEKEEGFVAQIQKIRSAFDEEKRQLQSQTDSLRRSETQLMESCEKLRTDSAGLENSNKLLVADTKKMAAEMDKTKVELSEQVMMYKARCEELEALHVGAQTHKSLYITAEEEKTRLQNQVCHLQSENSELKDFRDRYNETVAIKEALQGRVRSAETSLQELTENAAALTKVQSTAESLLEDKARLESELNVARQRMEETNRKLEQETAEKVQLLSELETSRVKLAEVNKSLEDVKAEHQTRDSLALGQRGAGLSLEQLTELQTQLREALGRANHSEKRMKEMQQETALTLLNTEGIHRHQLEMADTKISQLTSKLDTATRGLEETTTKYKQQCEESVRLGLRLKDQATRNAQLSEALYVTEVRQKQAEARYVTMAERCQAFKDMAYKVARAGVGR